MKTWYYRDLTERKVGEVVKLRSLWRNPRFYSLVLGGGLFLKEIILLYSNWVIGRPGVL